MAITRQRVTHFLKAVPQIGALMLLNIDNKFILEKLI